MHRVSIRRLKVTVEEGASNDGIHALTGAGPCESVLLSGRCYENVTRR